MNPFKKINQKLGFTPNESRVVLFLIAAFLAGCCIKLYMISTHSIRKFDYSVSDSVFAARTRLMAAHDSVAASQKEPKSGSYPKPFGADTGSTGKIHLNAATKSQLLTLPGIGESTANMIIAYREQHGKFRSIDDLTNIHGIGKKKLERLEPYLTL